MKKIIIPTILTATVLLAGMFAVMPVQKASSVHTTILAALAANLATNLANLQLTKVVGTGGPTAVSSIATITVTAGPGGPITIHSLGLTDGAVASTATVQVTSLNGRTLSTPAAVACGAATTASQSCDVVLALGTPITIDSAGGTAVITVALAAVNNSLVSATATVSGPGATGATVVMTGILL